MKKIIVILPFIFLGMSVSLYGAKKTTIAILDITATNTSKSNAEAVRDMLEIALYRTKTFVLLERNEMKVILDEQGFQATGCTDASCAVEIGKLLSADMVIIGSIIYLGEFDITIKFINIREGRIIYADSEKAKNENDISKSINYLVERATRNMTGQSEETKQNSYVYTRSGYYLRGVIPGWGQWYADRPVKGIVYFSLFTVSGALWGYSHINYIKAKDEYNSLNSAYSSSAFKDKRDAYNTAATRAKYFLGVFAASYLVNWVDIILFSKPDFNAKTVNARSGIFTDFQITNEYTINYYNLGLKMDLIIGTRF